MSQSSLVSYRDYSGKHWNDRKGSGIKRIVIHHCASVLTVEQLGRIFQGKQASSTYGIGNDGRVGQYVPEEYRPWTTSGWEPDRNCITIEVSNSAVGGNWPCSDAAMTKLVELCADICKRNGIAKLYYDGKNGTLLRHCDYHATACPGPYIKSKTQWIYDRVNAMLSGPYSQPAAYGPGDSYSETVDTGGTAAKTVYYILTGIKEYSAHDVYIRLLGSNDNSSWTQIDRANAFPGAYSDYGKVGSTSQSYRYYRIHCHRQSGGDRVGGMLAVMAE